ncbi:MAG: hypothetical protein HGB14_12235 [Anaerolineaceae bacterium]|nr:hypothetical protein [Anaerolineaceae bacterium]
MDATLLQEIRNWKLEAKLENNSRYFFYTHDVNAIKNGSRCFVIGRKGTGKTAISEYLNQQHTHKSFAQKLSFKNFPFNDLYSLSNESFRAPNQYITIWKYIIYSSIAKLMMTNTNIDSKTRSQLKSVYGTDPKTSLARTISRWTSGGFSLSILGSGGGVEAGKDISENTTSWIERVEVLEDLIVSRIDDSSYYIIFDELDEDYRDITALSKYGEYISLLTGLFKAVQDVKSVFPERDYNVFPIIFLRDDIYNIMKDSDKTKWSDFVTELEWNVSKIQNMLAHRISRALNVDGDILDFNVAWRRVFTSHEIKYGLNRNKKASLFDFITRSTQLRPRDYIRYLRDCADLCLQENTANISPSIVRSADKSFSNYLRSEIEDEICGILPEIAQILDILSYVRKQQFKVVDFTAAYKKEVESGLIQERNPESVLQILFHFSVIGNQPAQKNIQVFKYLNK